jgi:DNA-binding MarR family transcriptional regulator
MNVPPQARPRPRPEQWATHRLVSVAARITERRLNRQLSRLKLTNSALDALEAVAELEPTTASDIAELLCVSRQSLGKVLKRLHGLEFLTKEPAKDARSANIRITEAGRAALSTAEDLVQALPETEADAEFRYQLEQHITQLSNTEPPPPPRRSGTLGHHPGSKGLPPRDITSTSLNETGAHTWLQQTGQPAPRQPSKKQPKQ